MWGGEGGGDVLHLHFLFRVAISGGVLALENVHCSGWEGERERIEEAMNGYGR